MACAVGDYDGDGLNDLAVALDDGVRLFRNLGKGKFQDVTAEAGLDAAKQAYRNHVCGLRPRRRSGSVSNGRPIESQAMRRMCCGGTTGTRHSRSGRDRPDWVEAGKTSAAILTDFNNDRAVDLAVTGDGTAPLLFVNPREGKYPTQALYEEAKLPATRGHCGAGLRQRRLDGYRRDACGRAGVDAVAQCCGCDRMSGGGLSACRCRCTGRCADGE